MDSNLDNLRSLPTNKSKKKKKHIFIHIHTHKTKQNKTKRLLSKSIDNATQHYDDLSNGGLWDALVCYTSNMVGGGKNLRINIIMGRFCIEEESKWFFELQNEYLCKTHLDSYYSSTISLKSLLMKDSSTSMFSKKASNGCLLACLVSLKSI